MDGITTEALVFMLIVWGVVLLSVGYCFFKILTSQKTLGDDPADQDMPGVDLRNTPRPLESPDAIQDGPSADFKE